MRALVFTKEFVIYNRGQNSIRKLQILHTCFNLLKENAWKVPNLHSPLFLTQCCFKGRTMTQSFFQRQSNIDGGGGGGGCCVDVSL